MRDWLASGAMLNDDPELKEQLVSREYGFGFVAGNEAIQLKRKDDLKKCVASPHATTPTPFV